MDTNFNKKTDYGTRGFTLVELLAVIVVLAIVMLIAVNAVLPQMEKSRRNAFAIEVNGLISSAEQYVVSESLSGSTVFDKCKCVTVSQLAKMGHSKLKTDKYDGKVEINQVSNEDTKEFYYTYKVWLSNGTFAVNGAGEGKLNYTMSADDDALTPSTTKTNFGDSCTCSGS